MSRLYLKRSLAETQLMMITVTVHAVTGTGKTDSELLARFWHCRGPAARATDHDD